MTLSDGELREAQRLALITAVDRGIARDARYLYGRLAEELGRLIDWRQSAWDHEWADEISEIFRRVIDGGE